MATVWTVDRRLRGGVGLRVTVPAVPFAARGSPYPRGGTLVNRSTRTGRAWRGLLLLVTVVAAALWFGVARASAATNLLTNGSFETGDFTGWTATNPNTACNTDPFDGDPWTV